MQLEDNQKQQQKKRDEHVRFIQIKGNRRQRDKSLCPRPGSHKRIQEIVLDRNYCDDSRYFVLHTFGDFIVFGRRQIGCIVL